MDTSTEDLAVRAWLRLASPSEIDEWAEGHLGRGGEPVADIVDLFRESHERKLDAFLVVAEQYFGFNLATIPGARAVERVIADLCRAVLGGAVTVSTLCAAVKRLDAYFVSDHPESPVPDGLVELWNTCDWCNDSWTINSQPHLEGDLKAAIARLDARKPTDAV
jgi:hypothetical protein